MKTFTVEVTQVVTVELDETKFDEAFLAEFRKHFYRFDDIEAHAEHIAQLEARGMIDDWKPFIEGYGPAEDMGIKATAIVESIEIVKEYANA